MTEYFNKFPLISYDIDNSGNNRIVIDIFHRAKFFDLILKNTVVFYPYYIKDGETPEIIADKLYRSSQYHWVILVINDIFNLWEDWPLSYNQTQALMVKKYGSIATAQTTVDHYEDKFGAIIDYDTYAATIYQSSVIVYADQAIIAANESKKQIQLVDPQYVAQIENELDKLLVK